MESQNKKKNSRKKKLRKFQVIKVFTTYLPKRDDIQIVAESIGKVKTGEFLVKAEYISVDPYMRSFSNERSVPYVQFGFQVGKVIDSKNSEYPPNTYVVSHSGWRDYTILDGSPDDIFNIKPYQPNIGSLPVSLAIGALGLAAYLGPLQICKPKSGEIVCVTSAAGALGSLVGQIARLQGYTVIGFAGSDRKVQLLLQELGFHNAFNYKTAKIKESIRSVTKSIDCYFDNVRGDLATDIMECMNELGRVAVCG